MWTYLIIASKFLEPSCVVNDWTGSLWFTLLESSSVSGRDTCDNLLHTSAKTCFLKFILISLLGLFVLYLFMNLVSLWKTGRYQCWRKRMSEIRLFWDKFLYSIVHQITLTMAKCPAILRLPSAKPSTNGANSINFVPIFIVFQTTFNLGWLETLLYAIRLFLLMTTRTNQ